MSGKYNNKPGEDYNKGITNKAQIEKRMSNAVYSAISQYWDMAAEIGLGIIAGGIASESGSVAATTFAIWPTAFIHGEQPESMVGINRSTRNLYTFIASCGISVAATSPSLENAITGGIIGGLSALASAGLDRETFRMRKRTTV